MDLDSRFRPNSGSGGRIILLGDGTEISTEGQDGELFDNEDEDRDLDSQVNKYNEEASNPRSEREGTPGPRSSHDQVTESPSSVQTEKSDAREPTLKDGHSDKKTEANTTKTSEE